MSEIKKQKTEGQKTAIKENKQNLELKNEPSLLPLP